MQNLKSTVYCCCLVEHSIIILPPKWMDLCSMPDCFAFELSLSSFTPQWNLSYPQRLTSWSTDQRSGEHSGRSLASTHKQLWQGCMSSEMHKQHYKTNSVSSRVASAPASHDLTAALTRRVGVPQGRLLYPQTFFVRKLIYLTSTPLGLKGNTFHSDYCCCSLGGWEEGGGAQMWQKKLARENN